VLINGKKAAMMNTYTQHCGGMGHIISLTGSQTGEYQQLTSDVSFTRDGKPVNGNGTPEEGTTLVTGKKGLVSMCPDKNTVMLLLPYSHFYFKKSNGKELTIDMEDGSIFVNGVKADDNKQLILETMNESLARKGTRFIFTRKNGASRLIVYDGAVDLTLKKENSTITVPAGKVYYNDGKTPYTISDTLAFQSAEILATIPRDSLNLNFTKTVTGEEKKSANSFNIVAVLKKYWYGAAGVVLLLVLLITFRRKRPEVK